MLLWSLYNADIGDCFQRFCDLFTMLTWVIVSSTTVISYKTDLADCFECYCDFFTMLTLLIYSFQCYCDLSKMLTLVIVFRTTKISSQCWHWWLYPVLLFSLQNADISDCFQYYCDLLQDWHCWLFPVLLWSLHNADIADCFQCYCDLITMLILVIVSSATVISSQCWYW